MKSMKMVFFVCLVIVVKSKNYSDLAIIKMCSEFSD